MSNGEFVSWNETIKDNEEIKFIGEIDKDSNFFWNILRMSKYNNIIYRHDDSVYLPFENQEEGRALWEKYSESSPDNIISNIVFIPLFE